MQDTFQLDGADGMPIYGDITVNTAQEPTKIIIFIHGFKGFKDWGAYNLVAEYFSNFGYRFIKFNLSHSGANTEIPGDVTELEIFAANTFSKEQYDINAVLDYVKTTFPKEEIILMGHSRGGGLAILQAAKDKRISKLITLAAVDDFKNLWRNNSIKDWKKNGRIYIENARTKQHMPLNVTLLEDYEANKASLDINDAAGRIKIPWLIVHGDADPNVPFETAVNLQAKNPAAELYKISGADHVFGASHPFKETEMPPQLLEVCRYSVNFIKSH